MEGLGESDWDDGGEGTDIGARRVDIEPGKAEV